MLKRVYVETSVISYRAARPATDPLRLARQETARVFWEGANVRFRAYISDVAVREIREGDSEAARKRLELVREIEVLPITTEVERLASIYLERKAVSPNAELDALHVAAASAYALDSLTTRNCKHIANGQVIRRLTLINNELGLGTPAILTPEEFMKGLKP